MTILRHYIENLTEGQQKAVHRIVKWGSIIFGLYVAYFLLRWLAGLLFQSLSTNQYFSGSAFDYIDLAISLMFCCAILYVCLSAFIMAIKKGQ